MKSINYQIKLLTDATFGDGTADPFVINNDVLLDNSGFPYMRGKTIKGNIRSSLEEIIEYITRKDNEYNKSLIESIFGKEGVDSGNAMFSDLTVIKSMKSNLEKRHAYLEFSEYISKLEQKTGEEKTTEYLRLKKTGGEIFINNVSKVLTSKKSSILMENGVAADKSLRSERVINKGLIFEGTIDITNCSDVEIDCLKKGLKALKYLGSKKYRGRGSVKVDIISENSSGLHNEIKLEDNIYFGDNTLKNAFGITIENLEPVKLSSSNKSYDFESNKGYITGSSIRGAFISFIVANFEKLSTSELEKEGFIKKCLNDIIFSNFYPVLDINSTQNNTEQMHETIPTPYIVFGDKDTYKRYKEEKSCEYNFHEKSEEFKHKYLSNGGTLMTFQLIKDQFCAVYDDQLIGINVSDTEALHHKTSVKMQQKENLFRYVAIEKNQKFSGSIRIIKDDTDIKNALEMFLSSYFYIGGSRTSGYGKCKAVLNKISKSSYSVANDKTVMVMAQSDISINGYQKFIRDMEKAGLSLYMELTRKETIAGFNREFGGNMPVTEYIKMGSVLVFDLSQEFKTGDSIDNMITMISSSHYGDRVQEGFGKFVLINNLLNVAGISDKSKLYEKVLPSEDIDIKSRRSSIDVGVGNSDEKSLIENIVQDYTSQYFDCKLISSYDYMARSKETKLSKSQISDIQEIIKTSILIERSMEETLMNVYDTCIKDTNKSENESRIGRGESVTRLPLFCRDDGSSITLGNIIRDGKYQINEAEKLKNSIFSCVINTSDTGDSAISRYDLFSAEQYEKIILNHIYKVLEVMRRKMKGGY